MGIQSILDRKGAGVITIRATETVKSAADRMRARSIAALVVTSGDAIAGLISERDIVHALAEHGAALLTMKVDQLMTRRVVTCRPEDTVAELMARMTERRFRHLPVLKDGTLVGIVSIGDLVKSRLDEVEYEASSLRSFIVGA